MNTQKLTDALVEMKQQRALLDGAIKNIEGVLAALGESSFATAPKSGNRPTNEGASYIDLGVKVLADAGKPLHIGEIARLIGVEKGKNIPRASVESSFIRHIKAKAPSRVSKFGPAFFGLSAWKPLFAAAEKNLTQ